MKYYLLIKILFVFCSQNEEEPKDAALVKMEAVNAQVDEAKEVVNQNLELMMERGEKLEDLEHKTGNKKLIQRNSFILFLLEAITTGAEAFQKNTNKVSKKLWWKNIQATITFALVVLLIIVGIVIYFIYANKQK